ncbi:hypothetical protein B0A68_23875, partial [Flavobacterium reichenbachii]
MKNRLLPLFFVLGAYSAYSQVGIGTLTPNKSAQLEVLSSNRGMLVPRVRLTSTTSYAPIDLDLNAPAPVPDSPTRILGTVNSLLVYATETVGDIKPGYYYWFNDRWKRIATSDEISGSGSAEGPGIPGTKGDPGYPGENILIYRDTNTNTVYVQNGDGTWTPISGAKGDKGDKGEVGLAGGTGVPGAKGQAGYPGENVAIYTDTTTNTVYVQNGDGTWTPINGANGEVGLAGGTGVPGAKGQAGYPGENVTIYTDTTTNTVYVQNGDGTWTPINGVKGDKGDKGEVGLAGGTGVPGAKGQAGYPGENVTIYTDTTTNTIYVQNGDGTWTPINGAKGDKGDKGEVGLAGGTGVPGAKGQAGYPGENVTIYTDTTTNTVYVQNGDGTWTPINGAKGDKGEVGLAGGTGVPGAKGQAGYPGENVAIYTDTTTNTVYVQNGDGTWTPINGADGKSAFDTWKELPGNNGKDGADFIASITGATGATGADGESWTYDKFTQEQLDGLKGATGATGADG